MRPTLWHPAAALPKARRAPRKQRTAAPRPRQAFKHQLSYCVKAGEPREGREPVHARHPPPRSSRTPDRATPCTAEPSPKEPRRSASAPSPDHQRSSARVGGATVHVSPPPKARQQGDPCAAASRKAPRRAAGTRRHAPRILRAARTTRTKSGADVRLRRRKSLFT